MSDSLAILIGVGLLALVAGFLIYLALLLRKPGKRGRR